MKKNLFTCCLFLCIVGKAQVGINTSSPNATLDVVGKPTNIAVPDGVLMTRLTGDQLKAKDAAYGTAQNGATIFVTQPVTTASTKTALVDEQGVYFYDSIQGRWRKFLSSVPLSVQAFNGQYTGLSTTTNNQGSTVTLQFSAANIQPTPDIGIITPVPVGTNPPAYTTFTVKKAGVYTVYAGTQMNVGTNSTGTGAMTIRAGSNRVIGGSQLTINGSIYTVNCNAVFAGKLNINETISIQAVSGNSSWQQDNSFVHIIYTPIN